MKLMKLIESFLDEFPLSKQAEVLGLEYAGYGRWKDKVTGKIVAKTIDGRLRSIKGTGDNSVMSPADNPNMSSGQPTQGDSVSGNSGGGDSEIDAYMDQRSVPIVHVRQW